MPSAYGNVCPGCCADMWARAPTILLRSPGTRWLAKLLVAWTILRANIVPRVVCTAYGKSSGAVSAMLIDSTGVFVSIERVLGKSLRRLFQIDATNRYAQIAPASYDKALTTLLLTPNFYFRQHREYLCQSPQGVIKPSVLHHPSTPQSQPQATISSTPRHR